MLRRAGTEHPDEEMIHEELSGKIIGAGMNVFNEVRPYCAREELTNKQQLIFMPESYPCYLCNPWFVSDHA
jgi:hypothetical protein